MSDEHKLLFLPVLLKDAAADWWDTLTDDDRAQWAGVAAKFKERYQPSDLLKWQRASRIWSRDQGAEESVDDYVTVLQKMAKSGGVDDDTLRYAIMRGLRPALRSFVIQDGASTLADLIKAARTAEVAVTETTAKSNDIERVLDELKRMSTRFNATVGSVDRTDGSSSGRSPSPRRVTFANSRDRASASAGRPFQQRGVTSGRQPSGRGRLQQQQQQRNSSCGRCGKTHGQLCPAANVECFRCGRRGHLSTRCFTGRRTGQFVSR
jgi:Retrotransposon gag protein